MDCQNQKRYTFFKKFERKFFERKVLFMQRDRKYDGQPRPFHGWVDHPIERKKEIHHNLTK
jgi:hypothetical protein